MKKIVFLFFLFLTTALLAQSEKTAATSESTVTFKLDEQNFSSTIPFDEKFKLLLESANNINRIEIRYRIKNHVKDRNKCTEDDDKNRWKELNEYRHYFQYEEADDCGYITTKLKTVNSTKFTISDLGLFHPNIPYEFQFITYESAAKDATKDTVLKQKLLAKINEVYLREQLFSAKEIQKSIKSVIDAYGPGTTQLYDSEGKPIDVRSIINKDLPTLTIGLINEYDANRDLLDDYVDNNKSLKSGFKTLASLKTIKILASIKASNIIDKSLLTSPVNSLISSYNKVTLQEMINFFQANFNRDNSYVLSILEGKSKFKGNIVEPLVNETAYDIESLQLLASSLIFLKELRKNNWSNTYYFSQTSTRNLIEKIVDLIQKQISLVKKMSGHKGKMASISQNIPNILERKYLKNSIKVSQFSVVDVESEATPYINSDIGMVYASRLDDVFAAEIINLHAKPVNRKSFFNDLKGWDRFWKLSSLQIGIVQKLGGSNSDFEGIFGAVGTPYFGLGFRLNRMFRIGGGLIIYREQNPNPIITNTITKGSPSFSISFNSTLSDAFGIIGGLFKPNKNKS